MNDNEPNAVEIIFSSKDKGIDDKIGDKNVIWKDILSEGTIQIAPIPGGKKRPFKVISSGKSDPQNLVVSMTDLVDSYKDSAFKYVKIPAEHPENKTDLILKNTGYIEGVRIIKKGGKHFLQGAHGFTEPDWAGRVRRGSIPDVSSGILLNYTRKSDGKTFPSALHHVALTGDPIMPDLEPFKRVYASDDEINLSEDDIRMIGVNFADEEDDIASTGEIVWNEKDGSNWIKESLTRALTPDPLPEGMPFVARPEFYVEDIAKSKDIALVTEYFKGDKKRWVIPFNIDGDEVKPGPGVRWTEGKEALIAASDDSVFGEQSFSSVKGKIQDTLELMFGEDAKRFDVVEASLSNQTLIKRADGAFFLAEYSILPDGRAFLSDFSNWEKKVDAQPISKPNKAKIMKYDESTPDGRVAAAKERRDKEFGNLTS